MKLIVGLGNIGERYENTRHNVGFFVVDEMAKKMNIKINQKKYNSLFYKNDDFIVIKPTTFMNLSGEAVKQVMDAYKLSPNDLIVICDDLDIKVGQAKIKISTSSGGHNGIQNIIEKIGSSKFYRLKIGINRPSKNKREDIGKYVLSNFTPSERKIIDKVVYEAADAVTSLIYNDINYVINYFNRKREEKEKE